MSKYRIQNDSCSILDISEVSSTVIEKKFFFFRHFRLNDKTPLFIVHETLTKSNKFNYFFKNANQSKKWSKKYKSKEKQRVRFLDLYFANDLFQFTKTLLRL